MVQKDGNVVSGFHIPGNKPKNRAANFSGIACSISRSKSMVKTHEQSTKKIV